MEWLSILTKWLPDALNAVKLAQMALDAGKDATPHIRQAYDIIFKGKRLTIEERAQQRAQELVYSETIAAPLP